MTVKDVAPGFVFDFVKAGTDAVCQQMRFIKLKGTYNAVNMATWMACTLEPDEEVIIRHYTMRYTS